jgi:hypothetical protein
VMRGGCRALRYGDFADGLLAGPSCADNIARARELIGVPQDHDADADAGNPASRMRRLAAETKGTHAKKLILKLAADYDLFAK